MTGHPWSLLIVTDETLWIELDTTRTVYVTSPFDLKIKPQQLVSLEGVCFTAHHDIAGANKALLTMGSSSYAYVDMADLPSGEMTIEVSKPFMPLVSESNSSKQITGVGVTKVVRLCIILPQ